MSALAKTLEGTRNTRPGEAGQGSVFLAMTLPSWRTVIFGMRTRVSVHISSRWRRRAGSRTAPAARRRRTACSIAGRSHRYRDTARMSYTQSSSVDCRPGVGKSVARRVRICRIHANFIRRQLEKGGMGGLDLSVDDCRKTYEELSAKGVTFLQEPPTGRTACRRSYGTTPATGWCWWSPRSSPRKTSSRRSPPGCCHRVVTMF